MPSIESHLEQIARCSASIAELDFSNPKPFTNALLARHDITALIRDTDAHERALFHLAPPAIRTTASEYHSSAPGQRRATVYQARQPKNRAVAAVLGGDLYARTRRITSTQQKSGEWDVEALLTGAEKLAAVYPTPGSFEKISSLRQRHKTLAKNIAYYEDRVARNQNELQLMSRSQGEDEGDTEDNPSDELQFTQEDLIVEEESVKQLEQRKKDLEQRIAEMSRDLQGLET
ncbi:DASH complex, subunit Spc34 [Piedraia hortae CBS 480.64]|uniref:DASH complex subunit SPC34 n=1 Tax=Piedraia hortae CBS 480.64 TaxID=1314780 RepID=A0A6A7C4R7_9PEZI|nr:DASH complex, subunit Spc34 [Piedraia hortae CBS 480.64]